MIYKKKKISSNEEICRWANISDSKRNFKEGQRIIIAGHIIYCRKNIDFNGSVRLCSTRLSTSSLKGELHEIKREVSNSGGIISMTCSSKAVLGEKCKHVLGTLLYCHR